MNLNLILRGFSFRLNFYILLLMMIFAVIFNLIPQSTFKQICVVIVLLSAFVSMGPALLRTTQILMIRVSAIPIRMWELLYSIFKRKFDDLRYDEILHEIQDLCSLMEIKQKIKLRLVPNLQNAAAAGNVITFGKPLLEKLDPEEIKAIIVHELGHIKRDHLAKLSLYVFCFITVSIILVILFHNFTQIKLTNFTIVFFLIGIFAISLRVVSWSQEYEADTIAAQYVSKEAIKSAWLKASKMRKTDINWSYYSHPSISNRIANLDWPPNIRNKKWYLSLD